MPDFNDLGPGGRCAFIHGEAAIWGRKVMWVMYFLVIAVFLLFVMSLLPAPDPSPTRARTKAARVGESEL